MFSCTWRPHTLHFYCERTNTLQSHFVNEFTFDEAVPTGSIELQALTYSHNHYEFPLNSTTYSLNPASLQDLLGGVQLFYIDTPRFSTEQKYSLSPLSPLQKTELLRIYTSISSPKLYQNLIPEPDLFRFSHEYALVSYSQNSRNGSCCRNWIVQLGKEQESQSETCVCTWTGCLAPKCYSPVEFKAAEIAKTKKKLKRIVGNEFCRFHQCVNMVAAAGKNKTGCSELWPAVQGGVLWQNKIKNSSVFGKIIGNKVVEVVKEYLDWKKISINCCKTEKQLEIERIVSDAESFRKFKEKMQSEIIELRKIKDFESAATEELRKIKDYTQNVSNVMVI